MELFLAFSFDSQFPELGWDCNSYFEDRETEAQRCDLLEATQLGFWWRHAFEHSVLSVVLASKTQKNSL